MLFNIVNKIWKALVRPHEVQDKKKTQLGFKMIIFIVAYIIC